jgi:hypothetical protein
MQFTEGEDRNLSISLRVLTGGRGQRYVDWSFRGLRGGWALRPTLPTLQVYAKYYLA